MTSIDRIILWYHKQPPGVRSAIWSIQVFFVLYAGAIVENQVQVISDNQLWPKNWHHALYIFLGVCGLGSITYALRLAEQRRTYREKQRRETWTYASSLAVQYISTAASRVCYDAGDMEKTVSYQCLLDTLCPSLELIQVLVTSVYQVFESRFGESQLVEDRIDFEATFMTRSYDADNYLTILAYANRHGRAPRSMQLRQDQPDIYKSTIAAELYKDSVPRLRIIPDTADETVRYRELYPEQKKRIKSTLVHPILSPANRVLGVLVVHCNRTRFFSEGQRSFWEELLELFAKPLALEKLRLDLVHIPGVCALIGADPESSS